MLLHQLGSMFEYPWEGELVHAEISQGDRNVVPCLWRKILHESYDGLHLSEVITYWSTTFALHQPSQNLLCLMYPSQCVFIYLRLKRLFKLFLSLSVLEHRHFRYNWRALESTAWSIHLFVQIVTWRFILRTIWTNWRSLLHNAMLRVAWSIIFDQGWCPELLRPARLSLISHLSLLIRLCDFKNSNFLISNRFNS